MRTMAAGEFKAKCLGVIDEVKATGKTVLITKRGKPMARILPFEEQTPQESPESIFGFLRADGDHHRGHRFLWSSPTRSGSGWSNERWERFERGTEQSDPARYPCRHLARTYPGEDFLTAATPQSVRSRIGRSRF